jgi:hypothetical protein
MISLQAGARVWLATGYTDMRKGFDGLALAGFQVHHDGIGFGGAYGRPSISAVRATSRRT